MEKLYQKTKLFKPTVLTEFCVVIWVFCATMGFILIHAICFVSYTNNFSILIVFS